MKATEAAKILADRINQEHYVLSIMEKVYAAGIKEGKSQLSEAREAPTDEEISTAADKYWPTKGSGSQIDFIAGAKFVTDFLSTQKPEERKEPSWIRVSERMPEKRVNTVLAFNGDAPEYNQHVFIASYFTQTETWSCEHKFMGTVTHWKEITPPTEPGNETQGADMTQA